MGYFLGWYFDLPNPSETLVFWGFEFGFESSRPQFWAATIVYFVIVVFIFYLRVLDIRRRTFRYYAMTCTISTCILACLAVLISGLLLKYHARNRPVLYEFIDNSQSMTFEDLNTDRNYQRFVRNVMRDKKAGISRLSLVLATRNSSYLSKLYNENNIQTFLVSDEVQEFDTFLTTQTIGKSSQLPKLIKAKIQNPGDLVSGIIIWTDGRIIPEESVPWMELSNFLVRRNIPVYAVGVGNKTTSNDVRLYGIVAPEQIVTGEELIITGYVKCENEGFEKQLARRDHAVTLQDAESGDIYDQTNVAIVSGSKDSKFTLRTSTLPAGVHNLKITLQNMTGGNRSGIDTWTGQVEVTEQSFRVLLIADFPQFDFRFLQQVLRNSNGIRAEFFLRDADVRLVQSDNLFLSSFPDEAIRSAEFDVIVVFYSSGIRKLPANALIEFANSGGGIVFVDNVVESNTPDAYANGWSELLPYKLSPEPEIREEQAGPTGSKSEATTNQLVLTPDGIRVMLLHYFEKLSATNSLDEGDSRSVDLPNQQMKPVRSEDLWENTLVLARNSENEDPVFTLKRQGAGLVLWTGLNDFWLWRANRDVESYQKVWLQFLPTLASASRMNLKMSPRVLVDKAQYRPGEEILLRVFSPSHSDNGAISAEEVTVQISRNGVYVQAVKLRRESLFTNWFHARTIIQEKGNYEATLVDAHVNSNLTSPKVRFSVSSNASEELDTNPDHDGLKMTSNATEGYFVRIDNAQRLNNKIDTSNERAVNTIRIPLWNRWELMVLLVGLIGLEVFVRKMYPTT